MWQQAIHVVPKRISFLRKPEIYPTIEPLIGARLDTKLIFQHWEDLLRLATSIKQGTVTASTILRKLAAYPRRVSTSLRVPSRPDPKDRRTSGQYRYTYVSYCLESCADTMQRP